MGGAPQGLQGRNEAKYLDLYWAGFLLPPASSASLCDPVIIVAGQYMPVLGTRRQHYFTAKLGASEGHPFQHSPR